MHAPAGHPFTVLESTIRVQLFATLFVAIVLISSSAGAAAQSGAPGEVDTAALDAYVEAQMAKHGLPGVALAVVEGNEVVYSHGYGTAGSEPMTPQTQVFIGSLSKSFTALAIAQLAEEGRLDLDAPVRRYIPWFRVADEDASALITINHLLHHTSGLSESGYGVLLPPDASTEEAVRSLASARLTAPVGARHQYFNTGYDVLAAIVEAVTGQRYADYVKSNLFDPLGMARSTADPAAASNLAQGYTRLFGFAAPARQLVRDYEIGAGYIISTAEDLARYAIAMNGAANRADERLLSPESAATLFRPGPGNYAMGWYVVNGGKRIFHGGANETFRTDLFLYPGINRAFVLLVNEGHLVDHYVSAAQLAAGVEAIVQGRTPPPVSGGMSVRRLGWGLGLLVLGLIALHSHNFLRLRGWSERARSMSPGKKAFDVAISFVIPTVILIVVFTQMKAFFGPRFNLSTNLAMMRHSLPDVFVLMLIGTLPDYTQGAIKLNEVLQGKTKPSGDESL
jgi:CubicO group peptidase (beta-lactamase class C family)